MVTLHVLSSKTTLKFCQIIILNSYFGYFIPFYALMRTYILINFPWTIPVCKRGNGNVLITEESYLWKKQWFMTVISS